MKRLLILLIAVIFSHEVKAQKDYDYKFITQKVKIILSNGSTSSESENEYVIEKKDNKLTITSRHRTSEKLTFHIHFKMFHSFDNTLEYYTNKNAVIIVNPVKPEIKVTDKSFFDSGNITIIYYSN